MNDLKSKMHRVLNPHLAVKGLSLIQQRILIEDLADALQNRIKVFQSYNNKHFKAEVKTEPVCQLQLSTITGTEAP